MSKRGTIDFLTLLDSDFRWPREGDDPFVAPETYGDPGYAELPASSDAVAYFVSAGFMEAAQHLVAKAVANRAPRMALVLPILFCFRHAIETGIKRLLTEHGTRHGARSDRLTSTHDLAHLWECFLSLMASTAGDGDEEGIRAAGAVVMAFHRWDKGSFAFRYPTTTKGERFAFPLDCIDLQKLSDTMDGFANFLVGVEGQLDALDQQEPW